MKVCIQAGKVNVNRTVIVSRHYLFMKVMYLVHCKLYFMLQCCKERDSLTWE